MSVIEMPGSDNTKQTYNRIFSKEFIEKINVHHDVYRNSFVVLERNVPYGSRTFHTGRTPVQNDPRWGSLSLNCKMDDDANEVLM